MSSTEEHQQTQTNSNDQHYPFFGPKLTLLAKAKIGLLGDDSISNNSASSGGSRRCVELFALGGSVLDFQSGDGCIVNAANTGGVSGFGVDELMNRAGGYEMKEARRAFGGIQTGTAKSTSSYNHKKVQFVIHACGPVFRDNALSNEPVEEKYSQLESAYYSSMMEANRLECHDIGFCLLSAGVFRGEVPLRKVIQLGVDGITKFFITQQQEGPPNIIKRDGSPVASINKPERVALIAYTPEEQAALESVFLALG